MAMVCVVDRDISRRLRYNHLDSEVSHDHDLHDP